VTDQTQNFAISTVAAGAYNVACLEADQLSEDQIAIKLAKYLASVPAAHVTEALGTLVNNGLLKFVDGSYVVCDPKKRPVVRRNLEDVVLDGDGIPRGGWTGWHVRDFVLGLQPLPPLKYTAVNTEALDETERLFEEPGQ